jgi:hypothetical protein
MESCAEVVAEFFKYQRLSRHGTGKLRRNGGHLRNRDAKGLPRQRPRM